MLGSDLQLVEQVTGRLTTGRAALAGAGSGALLGLLFGLLVVIAHRLTTLRDADQVYVIDNGHVVDAGTHTELSKRTGGYRDMNDLLVAP